MRVFITRECKGCGKDFQWVECIPFYCYRLPYHYKCKIGKLGGKNREHCDCKCCKDKGW